MVQGVDVFKLRVIATGGKTVSHQITCSLIKEIWSDKCTGVEPRGVETAVADGHCDFGVPKASMAGESRK